MLKTDMLQSDTYVGKSALISVFDKTGVVDFAKELQDLGFKLYSTGGTAKAIADAGVKVEKISDLTGFPEILDGRVKTLHPKVHGGLLARLDDENHLAQMKKNGIESIDLLAVNLYPFEEAWKKGLARPDMIENIDIGGPAMIRSAAKNYLWTLPIVNPARYGEIIEKLRNFDKIDEEYRSQLAGEAFGHTAYYDSLISNYFAEDDKRDLAGEFGLPLRIVQQLRYGENPHQKAYFAGNFSEIFEKLHGKELSYNNLLDVDGAAKLIIEFDETALAIVKHTNPCGVGLSDSLPDAFDKAFATDKVSPFGGIIVVNKKIDLQAAEKMHSLFTELIIAPEFDEAALELLTKKKNRRLVRVDLDALRRSLGREIRSVAGGFLIQDTDRELIDGEKMKVATEREPTDEEMKALMFGWKIVKHVKSNAIVFTSSDRTLAIGAGQMSRVDSARIAAEKAKLSGLNLEGSIVASDAFFPFADGVTQAAEAGATAVIQPGGSVRDEEVIEEANKRGMAMIFTGLRHFRH